MKNVKHALLSSSIGALLLCSHSLAHSNDVIERAILTADRETMGSVFLKDLGARGTEVTVQLEGLSEAGTHAMHFHEKGLCNAPDFSSAGGHYNPNHTEHGKLVEDGPHAGDMMNIEVGSDGSGTLTVINERVSIRDSAGLPALFDDDGSALIIHAKADDYKSQPSGAAGKRIGCAVLEAR